MEPREGIQVALFLGVTFPLGFGNPSLLEAEKDLG